MLNITLPNVIAKLLVAGTTAAVLLIALPAQAQEVPEWAAPAQENQAATDRRAAPGANDELQDPPPFPTPLDPAGLALLAMAGGALAARRLRHANGDGAAI